MERRRGVGLGLALTVTVGCAVAAVPIATAGQSRGTGVPAWGACPSEVAATSPAIQCTTVPVPLDYRNPAGTTIDLTISRIASVNPQKRRGVLLLNPGGPGLAGLDMPAQLVNRGIPASVLDAYDLIGMDTRGIGHSAPVDCRFTVEQGYPGNVPPWAKDAATVAADAQAARSVAEQCAANDADGRMAHISTANTARDLDRIRAALGEEKASFFGLSYGSALGAAYASMFPATTDRVIIDSNLGDTALTRAALRRFGLGAEQAFPDFARWAAERHTAYGLGRTPTEVRNTYFAIGEQLDREPIPGLDGRVFRQYVFLGLYNDTTYPLLAQLWQSLKASDEAAAKRLMTTRSGLPAPNAQPIPSSNAFSAFLAVTCNDSDWAGSVEAYQRSVVEDRERYPVFGAASGNINACAFWSLGPSEPQVKINDRGPANILIMQNRRDAATPLQGGQIYRREFAKRSRLVTVDDNRHGVYVYGGNACALIVGTAWLVDGKLPRDTDCAASR
ncbi:alpha/beta hydrolase [Phytohabitans flavus]|uniref:Alpha/beta hydrolase n=2 Tax=Phytohabitans flavus TaxID=1076124 RepID=A0A6F8XN37_9ACTN|nr:alpha/beta hydrolase [Phytohabitans flavus]BCB75209.1 alpha/beta hydrolase [Phytohabitans flavus]